ncbi:hypothetical protein L1987_88849 [Smallanthus sonchifolius]|nr:hypothetical protein L1987_88849 [Smallanthus sonchifolius]
MNLWVPCLVRTTRAFIQTGRRGTAILGLTKAGNGSAAKEVISYPLFGLSKDREARASECKTDGNVGGSQIPKFRGFSPTSICWGTDTHGSFFKHAGNIHADHVFKLSLFPPNPARSEQPSPEVSKFPIRENIKKFEGDTIPEGIHYGIEEEVA